MKKPTAPQRKAKAGLGAPLGAACIMLAGAIVYVAVSMDRQPFLTKVTDFNMSSEVHRKIFAECLSLHKQLDELKFPHAFNNIEINLIDPLPSKTQITSALSSCLTKNPKSPFAIQGEVFSSEYEGKDGDVIVLQLNFIDKTGNKVMELNHHWTTSEFQPSEDTVAAKKVSEPTQKESTERKQTQPRNSENSFQEITEDGKTELEEKID